MREEGRGVKNRQKTKTEKKYTRGRGGLRFADD